jgi:hypothetical protein
LWGEVFVANIPLHSPEEIFHWALKTGEGSVKMHENSMEFQIGFFGFF